MAAQASAAGTANPGAPAAPVARLSSINGVYNGTYAGPEGPTKFKLTIMQLGQGKLGGTFTVYLTSNAGTQAYTYSLEGGSGSGQGWRFQLDPRDWDTVPPTNFEQRVIQGTFVPNLSQNTATISGVMGGTGFPKFEATWDAVESTNIPGAIAAQKAVGPPRVPPLAPSVVAERAAAHAEALKNAPRRNWRRRISSANRKRTGTITRPTSSGKSSTVVLAATWTKMDDSNYFSAPMWSCSRRSAAPSCRPTTRQ